MLVAQGTFEGRGPHEMSGRFTIEEIDGAHWFSTSEDFYFDGSPEPGFAVSASGNSTGVEAAATDFLRLPGKGDPSPPQIEVRGLYRARVPDHVEITNASNVFLWCFQFPSLLGFGRLEHV